MIKIEIKILIHKSLFILFRSLNFLKENLIIKAIIITNSNPNIGYKITIIGMKIALISSIKANIGFPKPPVNNEDRLLPTTVDI